MSTQFIQPGQKRISSLLGIYYRALETENFVYFVNYMEGDENACVKMDDKQSLELICNNYHYYNDMFCVLLENKFTYLGSTMKYNLKEYKKQFEGDSFFDFLYSALEYIILPKNIILQNFIIFLFRA